jgi:hypothetical protein
MTNEMEQIVITLVLKLNVDAVTVADKRVKLNHLSMLEIIALSTITSTEEHPSHEALLEHYIQLVMNRAADIGLLTVLDAKALVVQFNGKRAQDILVETGCLSGIRDAMLTDWKELNQVKALLLVVCSEAYKQLLPNN